MIVDDECEGKNVNGRKR